MKFISKKVSSVLTIAILFIGILLLWVYKYPFLQLPFFWDEAWSYAPAIFSMYKNQPCLLPGCLPEDLYRGHPLWFYFMNGVVTKGFGFSPFVLHTFALIVSSAFIIAFYFILRHFTNSVLALLGTLLLLSQEILIVQSSFALPEIFVSFMTIATTYCLVTGKNFLYFLSATLLVLTKETGLIITGSLLLAWFIILIIEQLVNRKRTFVSFVSYFIWRSVPVFIGIAFFVFQKITLGWYFYPQHVQLLNFSADPFVPKLMLVFDFVFTMQGRKFLAVIAGLTCILLFIYRRRVKISPAPAILHMTILLMTAFVVYAFFFSINFIMLRYLLPLVAIFIFLLCTWHYLLYQAGLRFIPILFCFALCYSLYNDFTSNRSWIDDVALNYKDVVRVHQQAVEFMEDDHTHSNTIFTHFLMQFNLTHPEAFYLHGPSFQRVSIYGLPKDADYYIFSNVEFNSPNYEYVKSNDSLQLIKRFDSGRAWCEIYKRE